MSGGATERPASEYENLRARKRPVQKHIDLVLDSSVADAWDAAQVAVDAARNALAAYRGTDDGQRIQLRSALAVAEADLNELRPQLHAASQRFLFQSIGREGYNALINAHPPTSAQTKAATDRGLPPPPWNEDTFPQALVAASLVEPVLTDDDVAAMWADPAWAHAELIGLFNTAIEANSVRRVVDLGNV